MGYLFVVILAGATLVGLYLSGRLPRMALEFAACAMLVGIAGYAWQGSPSLAGAPHAAAVPD
jgi:hypothetical protein